VGVAAGRRGGHLRSVVEQVVVVAAGREDGVVGFHDVHEDGDGSAV
jgi:hypothetical protein